MKLRMAALLGALAVGAAALAGSASAHFILVAPDSWIVENQLGDPQKAAPCGTSELTKGTPSGKVTAMVGGSNLHLKVKETIYHPGHYRVALAVTDTKELPKDPVAIVTEKNGKPWSMFAEIDANPKPPVLVDGLWAHRARPDRADFWETDIKLPNINCDACTLQVIQFMEQHGLNREGEYTYHHCAVLKITADPKLPISKGWPGQKK